MKIRTKFGKIYLGGLVMSAEKTKKAEYTFEKKSLENLKGWLEAVLKNGEESWEYKQTVAINQVEYIGIRPTVVEANPDTGVYLVTFTYDDRRVRSGAQV